MVSVCLARVMSDDVAGSVLVVLMYGGAFHDLLKSCGEGGHVFNRNAEPSSIKVKCQNKNYHKRHGKGGKRTRNKEIFTWILTADRLLDYTPTQSIALHPGSVFHHLGLQAVIQRVCIVSNFSFAVLHLSLYATGDHHIKTPLFVFSLQNLFSLLPGFFKRCVIFLHDRSGPAVRPLSDQLFCSEVKVWGE